MPVSTRKEFAVASRASAALRSAADWLLAQQDPAGFWCGELEGDSILQSEYILLLAWQQRERSALAVRAARRLLEQQTDDGGWSLYPGGPIDISASVKAYFALKLTGHDAESEPLSRARAAIMAGGGADRVNSFTRFYLALLGQIPYAICPAVPPEMVLLPRWSPINIYRISAWSRTILVPLSVIWAYRPRRELPAELGIAELFRRPAASWPALRCPQPADLSRAARIRSRAWGEFFRAADAALKLGERCHLTPWRSRALSAARQWMVERFRDSDGLGAIFPPIIWSVLALRCLGETASSPLVSECEHQLEALMIDAGDAIRIQPCRSPVWDTALSLRALATAVPEEKAVIDSASNWLLDKEVRRPGDWSVFSPAAPSGWFFEHRNVFYPDTDDTAMVLLALRESSAVAGRDSAAGASRSAACERGVSWLLGMQNRDGGWGAFDRDNDREFLCHVPFADHNAMIDPSTPDITARVLEAIAAFGHSAGDAVVDRAVAYLRSNQEADGSWYGRWGVNHIYGTWQVLTGLAAVGVDPQDPALGAGAGWLLEHQQSNGGWGESPASYSDASQRGVGQTTPSQTAWGILGLLATGQRPDRACERGIEYLLATQLSDGRWIEPEFTGTGFPLVFYLRYHMYPAYFPMLALARWLDGDAPKR